MKKFVWVTLLTVLVFALGLTGAVQAEIIPPSGEGQIGLGAVVLYDGLAVRRAPGADSQIVQTLAYGQHIIVTKQADGWAECVLSDSVDEDIAGWVDASMLLIDPAWYMTKGKTAVYAWSDETAPVAAQLDEYTLMPVLKTEGEWIAVPGGWIHMEAVVAAARQDGERFEGVIMIEGMEENVFYEHAVNELLGFEIDYEWESLERRAEAGRECFVSVYDDPGAPVNYLEVSYRAENADAACASLSEALSKDFEIAVESFTLERAGVCLTIDASEIQGGRETAGLLQRVYIISAEDGCLVAAAHYSVESAEGFGTRFSHMMNTLTLIDRNAE